MRGILVHAVTIRAAAGPGVVKAPKKAKKVQGAQIRIDELLLSNAKVCLKHLRVERDQKQKLWGMFHFHIVPSHNNN
jgi:hypothetical protein